MKSSSRSFSPDSASLTRGSMGRGSRSSNNGWRCAAGSSRFSLTRSVATSTFACGRLVARAEICSSRHRSSASRATRAAFHGSSTRFATTLCSSPLLTIGAPSWQAMSMKRRRNSNWSRCLNLPPTPRSEISPTPRRRARLNFNRIGARKREARPGMKRSIESSSRLPWPSRNGRWTRIDPKSLLRAVLVGC